MKKNYSVLVQAVPRINLIKISHSQVNIFIIFITFFSGEFHDDVAIMMKIRDTAISNQGGRGLASFFETIVLEKKIFKFPLFLYYLPLKMKESFIEQN